MSYNTRNNIAIVIPTYNEAENIESLIKSIIAIVPYCDLFIIDDLSPDGTADIAEKLLKNKDGSCVIRRTGPRGLGNAYCYGFKVVLDKGYQKVIQMDADLSHDPKYLPQMIDASDHADLVVGSRYVRGGKVENWPLKRVLLSRFANLYVKLVTSIPIHDATAGYRCWSCDTINKINLDTLDTNGYAFQVAMVYRTQKAKLKIVEIPITFRDRIAGNSKMTAGVISESIILPWKLRFDKSK